MTKGTASAGRHSRKKNHIRCRRCGKHSYHVTRNICSSCGYGNSPRKRQYTWSKKSVDN